MRLLVSVVAFVAALAYAGLPPPSPDVCEDLSCASKEELLDMIQKLQQEKIDMGLTHMGVFKNKEAPKDASLNRNVFSELAQQPDPTPPSCNICASNPCLNGGTCHADPNNPWNRYYCECPDVFAGTRCETNVSCTPKSCGKNADCYVSNHQTNCICQLGYTASRGDPRQGCTAKIAQACADGDPHFNTFDNLRLDYQGTCPYVFSQPCGNLTGGFTNYKVVAKNELVTGAHVSYVNEVEVTMYGQKVHIDRTTRNVYFNGFRTTVPYYFPSKSLQRVAVTYSSGNFYVQNDQLVIVTFSTNGRLCIQVPDVPQFRGNATLCGLAGNLDDNYKNDVVYSNGTVYPIVSSHMPTSSTVQSFNHAEDTWITDDFMPLRAGQDACITGEILGNNTNCDPQQAVRDCNVILQAKAGQGVFGACQVMGNETIENYYDNCVFDLCNGPNQKCSVITNFARTCMDYIPNVGLGNWRSSVDCALNCPLNSQYSTCASSCPATCFDQSAPDFCGLACSEGCSCQPGYVLDTTQLTASASGACIPVQQCGCLDGNQNYHPAEQPWLSNNCQLYGVCRNGTYFSKINQCNVWAYCGKDSDTGAMECKCDQGFTGDGYTCDDINECLDPNSCSQNVGQGSCYNYPGSYNCTCSTFYEGHDCQFYKPRRHCADLFNYWGYRTDGVYTINPNYPVNGHPALSGIQVYCDMTILGGGWTLLSHDNSNGLANKTLANYVVGFGDVATQNMWLGLDLANKMTNEMETSLMLKLFRCAHGGQPSVTTQCTYPTFTVGDKNSTYAVTIPEVCQGTEVDYYDGWARWALNETGPGFRAYDNDDSKAGCSKTFQNTGFWFDTKHRCGSANLNGVRYSCANQPDDSGEETWLFWNGSPLGDAWLWLRPKNFPNYDPQHPVPN